MGLDAISREQGYLKMRSYSEIFNYLIEQFGEGALRPVGQIDRPFTSTELANFSSHFLVRLGKN